MKIQKIASNVPVAPLLWALQSNEHLWNKNTERTASVSSPHHGLDDIWARYAADAKSNGEHDSVWYPSEITEHVKAIVYPLMQFVQGDRLGGVLITRIKAGKECRPHQDNGWHARYYKKFGVQIQSAPGQKFCFDNEELETMPGDVFMFKNEFMHWVKNDTPHDRITMIVCIKTDREWE